MTRAEELIEEVISGDNISESAKEFKKAAAPIVKKHGAKLMNQSQYQLTYGFSSKQKEGDKKAHAALMKALKPLGKKFDMEEIGITDFDGFYGVDVYWN